MIARCFYEGHTRGVIVRTSLAMVPALCQMLFTARIQMHPLSSHKMYVVLPLEVTLEDCIALMRSANHLATTGGKDPPFVSVCTSHAGRIHSWRT